MVRSVWLVAGVLVACGHARLIQRTPESGTLALVGPDRRSAINDAHRRMTEHCGPGNYTITHEGEVVIGRVHLSSSKTQRGDGAQVQSTGETTRNAVEWRIDYRCGTADAGKWSLSQSDPESRRQEVASASSPPPGIESGNAADSPVKEKSYQFPPGSKFLPDEQVEARFGLTPEKAVEGLPAIERAMRRIVPGWDVLDLSVNWGEKNRILRLRDGREWLILSGRGPGHCGGGQRVLIYDLISGVAAYGLIDMDLVDRSDLGDVPDFNLFSFQNGGLEPRDDVLAVLWLVMKDVENVGGPPDCYYGREDEDTDQ